MLHEKIGLILSEIQTFLPSLDEEETELFITEIRHANKIVGIGAGRVGMAVRAFIMRLKHLGLDSYFLGDSNVPGIGHGDLCLVASGSGETQSIFDLVKTAKQNGARIALITGNPDSRMGQYADTMVQLKAPSKVAHTDIRLSAQPMTTLNEQCLALLFDALVLVLMDKTNETHETMWGRHSNLE